MLLALVLVAESIIMFALPSADAPKQTIVDQAPITYLLNHQGQQRFLDFAVLFPNLGSQYGLNSLGAIDLPFPKSYKDFIEKNLFPGLTPENQFVIHNGLAGENLQQQMLLDHFAAYQGASVKYLVLPTALPLLHGLTALGVKQVFSDATATIYLVPNSRPFFSTSSSTCTVTSTSVNAATVQCPTGSSTLLRTELSMAGWHASINGKSVDIATVDGVYQSVSVPQGTSNVTYSFTPPHEKYAVLAGLVALFFLLGSWLRERYTPRRAPRHRAT